MEFQTNQKQVETKKCKHCGMDIPAQAKVCPYCNKKQKHTVRNVLLIILGVVILLGVLFSCMGGSNNSNSSGTVTTGNSTQTNSATTDNSNSSDTTVQETQNYTVGSTFEENGIGVTLDSVNISTGDEFNTPAEGMEYLIINWTIVNNSDEEFNTFDINFNTYVDGTKTEMAITGISGGLSAADILPAGTNVSGNRVYEVPVNWQECQIRVQNGLIGGDSVTFTVTPDQVS